MSMNKNQILPRSKTSEGEANDAFMLSPKEEVDQSTHQLIKAIAGPASSEIVAQPRLVRKPFSGLDGESVNFKITSVEEMLEIHKTNKLENQQAKSAKEFMNKVMYSVPLNQLYRVKSCCQYNENANYCPVIIEIIDKKILEYNDKKKYLIQVWSKRGEMIFEKPTHRPCCNFNINDNVFVFQEETDSPEVYVVKLHLDQKSILYKFTLPTSLTSSHHINSYFDEKMDNFVIPQEKEVSNARDVEPSSNEIIDVSLNEGFEELAKPGKHNVDDIFEMQALGEFESQNISEMIKKARRDERAKLEINNLDDFPNVSTFFSDKIINRAPDKMIDFLQGNILLAYRNLIISADVSEYVRDEPLNSKNSNIVHIKLAEDKVQCLDLHQNYKIIAIYDIGIGMSAIVLEDLITRQIRFLRTELDDKVAGTKRLKLIQLGLMINQTKMTQSKLIKFRSVAKIDPKTQRNYQISLVLRENGRVEVYSDFMLVNEYSNPTLQCVDIETDFHQFYLKFVKDSDKVTSETKFEELQYEMRQVRHSWRNRISFNTMKLKKNIEQWNIILHRRIAGYFRLYTQVLNFSTFMLVSHRNMISIFAMGQTDDQNVTETWIDTIKFEQGNIRKMFIKKRPKDVRQKMIQAKIAAGAIPVGNQNNLLSVYKQFQLVIMIGTHTVATCALTSLGKLTKTHEVKAPGRIIRFRDDSRWNQGMLLLIDDSPEANEYTQLEGCYSFNFPYSNQENNRVVRLYSLKMESFYELTNSAEHESLAFDSYFDILRANKHSFVGPDNPAVQGENEIKRFFKEFHVNVILISSRSKNSQTIVPIVKEKNKEGYIETMRLIKKEAHQKKFPFDDGFNFESHIHCFFATSKDFDKNVDNYCNIGHKALKIYDEDMKLRFIVQGLSIRSCTDVHQGYLYSINDSTTVPYTVKDGDDSIVPQPDWKFSPSGLYVMDLQRLFEGKVERYKLASTVGGYANVLDDSKFSDRFSFISSFDSISVIPFPHMNVLNCVGMALKHEYLIWRQNDGFFTALDGKSNLYTWSTITGKMLYSEKQRGSASAQMLDHYEVYRSDVYDTTYTQDFYNLKDYSISLLKSKKQVNAAMTFLNQSLLMRKLQKHEQNKKLGINNVEKGVRQLERNLLQPREGAQGLALKVLNSHQKANLYHFKVMELKTHEDTKGASECHVRFHFMFELIEKKMSHLANYEWSVKSNPIQRLYLSRDTRQMMEVINNLIANVYVRDDIDEQGQSLKPDQIDGMANCQEDYGQQVKWKIAYRIKRFPMMLQGKISQPYLFSPNFTYQLDFNHHTEQFVIKYTRTQHIYMNIPNDLLSLEWSSLKGENALKMVLSRFKWEEEDVIRIINRANLDCLFQLSTTDPTDQDIEARYLKLISCVKVDNLFVNMTNRDEAHVFFQKKVLSASEVLARLIQLNQNYKVNTQHAVNTGRKGYNLLREINNIDFKQRWGDNSASFDIQMSFTWLDWYIGDKLLKGEIFNLDNMDIEQKIHLVFNIFPQGNGILHLLSRGKSSDQNDNSQQTTDQLEACQFAKELFKLCSETHKMNLVGTEDAGCSFEVPILPNMYGQTPLDICMSVNSLSGLEDDVFFQSEEAAKQIEGSENIAMANEIFKNLTNYSFMHSSYQITDSLLQAIRLALPSIGGYLESRMAWIEHSFSTNTQNAIKGKHLRDCPASGEYGAMCTSIWTSEKQIKKEIFEDSGPLLPMRIVQIDVPHLHSHNPLGFQFIEALDDCENVDIFKLESVQILIDNQYDYWKKINNVAIGFPTVLQVLVFWYWSNVVIQAVPIDPDTYQVQETICRIILIITCVYLLLIESSAMIVRKLQYLTSLEKITNLVNLVLIMINVIRSNNTETIFMEIQTWAALIIWFRFLLFLKSLPTFAWLIRMLLACIYDMLTFLAVLFIGVIAFADAFKSIDAILVNEGIVEKQELPEDASGYELFFQNYIQSWQKAWRVALGDFAIDLDNYREQDYFVFFICCIFNIILLFNLLIAIISKTFEDINDAQIQMGYKEKVKQIKSLQDSLYGFKKAIYNPMELLFVVSVISGDEEKEKDVPTQIGELSEKIDTMKDELKKFTEEQFEQFAETIAEKFGNGQGSQPKKGKKNFIQKVSNQSFEEPEDAKVAKVQAGNKGLKTTKK